MRRTHLPKAGLWIARPSIQNRRIRCNALRRVDTLPSEVLPAAALAPPWQYPAFAFVRTGHAGNLDPENRYVFATYMAFCGEKDVALRLLKTVVEAHYCAYTAMQKDPLLASLRGTPEFTQLLPIAKQCEYDFLAERAKTSP